MKKMLEAKVSQALASLAGRLDVSLPDSPSRFVVEEPKDPDHGHLATNAAMIMAKAFQRKPTELADLIIEEIDNSDGYIEKLSKAGPGFINFTLGQKWWSKALADILRAGDSFGRGDPKNLKVMVEYVSANPTGPLHVGHGRGAAIGDALIRVMRKAGYEVTGEYYINDAGRQMRILGESVYARLKELDGSAETFPEDHYRGEYIKDMAREYLTRNGRGILETPADEAVEVLGKLAGDEILQCIKDDLAAFRVEHEIWFSEKSLYTDGSVDKALDYLRGRGYIYEKDGAVWFKAEALGDDKDRVLIKSTGEHTYFAADIAYHWDKFNRGFDQLIDIWGADHHGYIPRMKAAVEAMGKNRDDFAVVLVQLVSLVRDGQPVAMSTRAGEFVTLREVVDEVGADAARFMFLTRGSDTTLEFDLDLAKAKTKDNPVYYVQYVGARIESIIRAAGSHDDQAADFSLLTQPEETALIKHLASFPELIETAARKREPHHLTAYLSVLARLFHHYYAQHRIAADDRALAKARLELVRTIRLVVRLGLELLGVGSPDSM